MQSTIRTGHVWFFCVAAVLYCFYAVSAQEPGESKASEQTVLDPSQFIFLSGKQAVRAALLECPNHAFGTRQKGLDAVELAVKNKTKPGPTFIQLCVGEQPQSLMVYGPKVEWISLNPFASLLIRVATPHVQVRPVTKKMGEVWGNSPQRVLKRLNVLNSVAPLESHLLGRIDMGCLEPGVWAARPPTEQELRWCVIALCGAGYNGVVWVGQTERNSNLIKSIEKEFSPIAKMMAGAKPVAGRVEAEGAFATLVETEESYILCVLSPDYMKIIAEEKATSDDIKVASELEADTKVRVFRVIVKDLTEEQLTGTPSRSLVKSPGDEAPAWKIAQEGLVLEGKLSGAGNLLIWPKAKGGR